MLLRALQRRHDVRGFLADEDLEAVAAEVGVPVERVTAVARSYPRLRRSPPPRTEVVVCRDLSCRLRGARGLVAKVRAKVGDGAGVEIREGGCLGRCDVAPAASVDGRAVGRADAEGLAALAKAPAKTPKPVPPLSRRFEIDPYESALDRFATARALAKGGPRAAGALVAAILDAGLRDLRGVGLVAMKWDRIRQSSGAPKSLVMSALEAGPGAFRDREILAQAPYLPVEGLVLGALAVGAEKGFVVVRPEHAAETESLEDVIASARKKGVLGANACGSGRPFDVEVVVAPGGYVLGDSSAILALLEDDLGQPREAPPDGAERTLFGGPTAVHDVETFACVPAVAAKGAAWWKSQGKRGARGLALFAVSGHVEKPGVYEVPRGTTAGELLSLAGGVLGGKALKAFAAGGASAGFLPASKLDIPLDFDPLAAAGSPLATGAVVYVAIGTDMLELARTLTSFFASESCGRCGPCHDETARAAGMLDDVLGGRAGKSVVDLFAPMHETLEKTSICALGKEALVPLVSVLDRFPRDVLSHVGSGLIALADVDKE